MKLLKFLGNVRVVAVVNIINLIVLALVILYLVLETKPSDVYKKIERESNQIQSQLKSVNDSLNEIKSQD